jgi:hypothetical protein
MTQQPKETMNYIPPLLPHLCNNTAHQQPTQAALIQYLHAAAFSPSKSTWIEAIRRGHFQSWPGLSVKAVHRHLKETEATAKGHMDQTRKNIRSTRRPLKQPTNSTPQQEQPNDDETTHLVFATIEETGKIYTDQTGRFPVTSSRGTKYVMVLYDYDSNAVLTEPLKNRTGQELFRAYTTLHQYLCQRGFTPQVHWLDNEAAQNIKDYDKANHVDFQLVPPHSHRRNAAERAIRTWKNHFIAGLCSTAQTFPNHLWDRLIPQATITLNLLRTSRRYPKLSAYQVLEGNFDFNKTPMAPPGTKVQVHEKPNQRKSWDPHSVGGWYLGPALDHYRCYRVFINQTKAERISDTVQFFPEQQTVPFPTPAAIATEAARTLISVLKEPTPSTTYTHIPLEKQQALQDLAEIFRPHLQLTNRSTALSEQTNERTAPRVATVPPTTNHESAPHIIPMTQDCTEDTAPPRVASNQPTPTQPHRYPTRARNPMSPTHHIHSITHGTSPMEVHQWANAIIDPTTGKSLEYRHLIKTDKATEWINSFANELGRLAQGVGKREVGTNTIFFLPYQDIPEDRKGDITYGRLCVDYRPQKTEPNRTRLTVGGNLIDYPGDVSTPTANITTAKLIINSTLSTKGAKYMCGDIKNFYLGTPMARYEYMRIPIAIIPDEIIEEYNLLPLVRKEFVYVEIRRGMYGLPQAGIIANDLLTERLEPSGYYQCRHTPGLWKHKWRPILFSLVVDDFGIQYVGRQHVDHLIQAIEEHYEFSKDWEGALYCGITIKWDYHNKTADLSMPGYIKAALHKYQHPTPRREQHAPHDWTKPTYGATVQYAPLEDDSVRVDEAETKRIQQIAGTLLYYAKAVDSTLLVALGTIAAQQANATLNTTKAIQQLLDYCHTHPEAVIRYRASDMILKIHSDASYLSEAKARSRSGGHFYMGDQLSSQTELPNGPILTKSTIMKNVMGAAAEAECGALYDNAKEAVPLRTTLEEMGHKQPPTPIQVDNSTTNGFANRQIKQKRSKAMDMRFYWIQDRVSQKQFQVYWRPGHTNLADYFTKHHAPAHHRRIRSTYLHCLNQLSSVLRGCVESRIGTHLSRLRRTQNPMPMTKPTPFSAPRYYSLT